MRKYVIDRVWPEFGKPKLRIFPHEKLLIDGNTPVGEDCNYYESKPYGGKRAVNPVGTLTVDDHGKITFSEEL